MPTFSRVYIRIGRDHKSTSWHTPVPCDQGEDLELIYDTESGKLIAVNIVPMPQELTIAMLSKENKLLQQELVDKSRLLDKRANEIKELDRKNKELADRVTSFCSKF